MNPADALPKGRLSSFQQEFQRMKLQEMADKIRGMKGDYDDNGEPQPFADADGRILETPFEIQNLRNKLLERTQAQDRFVPPKMPTGPFPGIQPPQGLPNPTYIQPGAGIPEPDYIQPPNSFSQYWGDKRNSEAADASLALNGLTSNELDRHRQLIEETLQHMKIMERLKQRVAKLNE